MKTKVISAAVLHKEVYIPLRDKAMRNGRPISDEVYEAVLRYLGLPIEILEHKSEYRKTKRDFRDEPTITKGLPEELKVGRYF